MKLALQLYTVRDLINSAKDLLNILPKVKDLGFDGVEFAGYFGASALALKNKLDETGLVPIGTHLNINDLDKEKLKETIEYNKILGCRYLGTGGGPHDTIEESENTAKILENAAKESGITTYYHNHWEEFAPFENGKTALDIISAHTKIELDAYWSFHAGIDNYKYITEHKDDILLIHIKDGVDGQPKALKEGNCDLDAIVKAAKEINLEWLILENDDPEPDGLSDVKRSMEYLKTI